MPLLLLLNLRVRLIPSYKNVHACVSKRHSGVQAWINRSARLWTAIDFKSYGKGKTSHEGNPSREQKCTCSSLGRLT